MQNKIDTLAIIAFISAFALSSCASEHPIEVRYEKQQIPSTLLECPSKPQCKADMQSEVARCLVEYDAALAQCRGRIQSVKELIK